MLNVMFYKKKPAHQWRISYANSRHFDRHPYFNCKSYCFLVIDEQITKILNKKLNGSRLWTALVDVQIAKLDIYYRSFPIDSVMVEVHTRLLSFIVKLRSRWKNFVKIDYLDTSNREYFTKTLYFEVSLDCWNIC